MIDLHSYHRHVCSALITMLLALPAAAQSTDAPDLSRALSESQFRAAGLHKLTEAELRNLNRFARAYALTASALQEPKAPPPSASMPNVIESRIDGEFEGWDGETLFKLMNGQIWQQVTYQYRYHYAYMPNVLIYRSGSTYKMKVDGVDGEIVVRRIK